MDAEQHDPRHHDPRPHEPRQPERDADGTPAPAAGPRRVRGRAVDGQLRLLNTSAHPEWKLDDATRAVGRRGVAQARAALRAARGDHGDGTVERHRATSSRRSDAA